MIQQPRCKHSIWATIPARLVAFFLLVGWLTQPAAAQDGEAAAPPLRNGLQIQNVSAYAAYYSKSLPNGAGYQPGTSALLSDVVVGGSTQIGWTKSTQASAVSLVYTTSYTGRVRYSSWNSWNHGAGLTAQRHLSPRWTLTSSVNIDLSTQESFLFAPTVLTSATSAPASFDDLAAALLSSKFSNVQLASAFSSAPAAQSPVRTLLYGTRMVTAGAHASVSYAKSPRLSLTFGGGGGRTQHASDAGTTQNDIYLLSDTTSASGNFGFSYSLSPFTQFGADVSTSRVSSSLYETQTTTSTARLGRTIARRLLAQIHGGVGATNYSRQQQANSPLKTKARPAFGGSLAFKTFTQTFAGSYERTVSDAYGLGASTSSTSNASWRWGRPHGVWWLESSLGWEQLQGAAQDIAGWRAAAGLGRAFGNHFVLLTQYAYLNYSGTLSGAASELSQSAVQVSVVWTPHPERQ